MPTQYSKPIRARSAPSPRRAAGLLLAGTILAVPPAQAQEPQPPAAETGGLTVLAEETIAGYDQTQVTTAAAGVDTGGPPPAAAPAAIGDDSPGVIPDTGRVNLPAASVDGLRPAAAPLSDEPPGVRLGTFILRPTVAQGLGYERTKTGGETTSRTFSTTTLRGVLTSDWSRHQLTIIGAGTYEKNLSDSANTEPEANVAADLRLDLADETIANLTAGYSLEREDSADPNAISGARVQSAVQNYSGGASIRRDFGLIRGTLGAAVDRETYGDVELSDGSELSQKDRNNTTGVLSGRIGYEVSPALIPFIEASGGRVFYDETRDFAGYARSGNLYNARAGVELDLGEKLRGEFGIGFDRRTFDDDRLKAIDALALDGAVDWSPQRGTNVNLALRTAIEPSTTPGESGYISYLAATEITHELRSNLVARLAGSYEWRDFPASSASNQNVYIIGTGLSWNLNRYVALSGDISYELTTQKNVADTGVTRAGLGLVLRR